MVKAPCAHLLALRCRLQTRGQEEMAATRAKVQEFAEQSASLEQDVKQKEAHIKALQVCPAPNRTVLLHWRHFPMLLPALHVGTQRCVSGSLSICQGTTLPSGTTACVQHVLQAGCRPLKHSTQAFDPPCICMHPHFI